MTTDLSTHEFEQGDTTSPMHSDALCAVCGKPWASPEHGVIAPRTGPGTSTATYKIIVPEEDNRVVATGMSHTEAQAVCSNNPTLAFVIEEQPDGSQ